jgi:hypothetical protein
VNFKGPKNTVMTNPPYNKPQKLLVQSNASAVHSNSTGHRKRKTYGYNHTSCTTSDFAEHSHSVGHRKWTTYKYNHTPCSMSDAEYTNMLVLVKGLIPF